MEKEIRRNRYGQEYIPTYTRRKQNHNYYGTGTYHIILKKQKGAPDFSRIVGDAKIAEG